MKKMTWNRTKIKSKIMKLLKLKSIQLKDDSILKTEAFEWHIDNCIWEELCILLSLTRATFLGPGAGSILISANGYFNPVNHEAP